MTFCKVLEGRVWEGNFFQEVSLPQKGDTYENITDI
jgi:hypothetical protein